MKYFVLLNIYYCKNKNYFNVFDKNKLKTDNFII